MLEQIRIVLVETSHPGNIGAAARAMKTMGLQRLVLVAPQAFPHPEAVAMAAGAVDVLEGAQVCADLDAALAGCRVVLGCTARRRSVALPGRTPRQAAAELLQASGQGAALLFGRERTGLTNEELQRCHAAVHIDANPDYSSLNLAAAVQVLSYELRMAMLAAGPPPSEPGAGDAGAEPGATLEQLEGFFAHLDQTLEEIDFHKGRAPDVVMQRLRRLFLRARADAREVRILRGILTDAQRMARLAREAGKA